MNATLVWEGTYLQAALLIPSGFSSWGSMVARWSRSGALARGTGRFTSVRVRDASFDILQDPSYLPVRQWDEFQEVAPTLEQFVPSWLDVPMPHPLLGIRLRALANPDSSISLYVCHPMARFEDCEPAFEKTLFDAFVEACISLSDPETLLVGTIGEESRLTNIGEVGPTVASWSGRAIYGRELASGLSESRSSLASAGVVRERDGLLFVSWGSWPTYRPAPPEWQAGIRSVMRKQVRIPAMPATDSG